MAPREKESVDQIFFYVFYTIIENMIGLEFLNREMMNDVLLFDIIKSHPGDIGVYREFFYWYESIKTFLQQFPYRIPLN